MKKITLLLSFILCFFALGTSANTTDDYLQGLGTFDEGTSFIGTSGDAEIADQGENPFKTGNVLKLVYDNTSSSTSYSYIKPANLADMAKGANYTKMRVVEFDFCIEGGEYNSSSNAYISLPIGMLRAYICKDNKTFDLKLHGTSTTLITNLELNKNHHLKFVYEVIDVDTYSSGTKYRARATALFVDGKAYNTSPLGNYLNNGNSYYHNYINHSGATDSDKSYGIGIKTLMNTSYALRFEVAPLTKATLFVDNLKYYGTNELCYLADSNGDYLDEDGLMNINPFLKNKLYINLTGKNKETKIYLAFYNEKGQLTSVSEEGSLSFGTNESTQKFVKELGLKDGTHKMRILCWEDTLSPSSNDENRSLSAEESDENMNEVVDFIYENIRKSMELNTTTPDSTLTYWDDETGSFTDINYSDKSSNDWQPVKHLDRLGTIAAICYSPRNPKYHDAELKAIIVKGLNFWYSKKDSLTSSNWWYNDRDVPERIADILFFQPEGIDATVLKYFSDRAKTRYISMVPGSSKLRYYGGTAQGVFDRLNQSFKLAYAAQEGGKAVYDEFRKFLDIASFELTLKLYADGQTYPDGTAVVLNDTQSIKADYSYHEHQNLLLSTTYGREFLKSTDAFLSTFKNTDMKLSDEAAYELSKILLDGFRWVQYNGYSDPSTQGRNYGAYGSTLKNSIDMKEYIDYLLTYLVENYPDADFIEDVNYELNRKENFSGNRHFWQSDYSVHNRSNYHFSVRSSSNRVKTSEQTNGEGLQARYQGDGMVAILTRGAEYSGLGGAYDWNKLPGTTTDQSRTDMKDGLKPDSKRGNTTFVGGVSDGEYGLHTFDYNRDGVAAKKSWFMFDDEIVALGGSITSESTGEIYTSINQTALNGDVWAKTLSSDAGIIENGDRTLDNVEWVLHDGIGYVFTEPADDIQIMNQSVKRDWSKNDSNKAAGTYATKNIFLLGQSHGTAPSNKDYCCIMVPNATTDKLKEYKNPVTVLANTSKLQAVWHSKLNMLQAVFYDKGNIELPNGVKVAVNRKCALMVHFDGDSYKISISNPENKALDVTVTLSGSVSGSHRFKEAKGDLGNDAGKTYIYEN